jgi:transcriptional regulator with XRE-family HTH domain
MQGEFAKLFGVTQSMVSMWERGRSVPSVDNWLALANLAGYPECFWFWERAGLRKEKLLAATEKAIKEQTKGAKSAAIRNQVILVPYVRKTPQGLEPTGESIAMPAVKVPNPASTFCFQFEGESPTYRKLAPVVDTTDADVEHFGAFWSLPILAEFDDRKFSGQRLRMGVLTWEGHSIPWRNAEFLSGQWGVPIWGQRPIPATEAMSVLACFMGLGDPPSGLEYVGRGLYCGGLNVAETPPWRLIQPVPGFTILGRVIAP